MNQTSELQRELKTEAVKKPAELQRNAQDTVELRQEKTTGQARVPRGAAQIPAQDVKVSLELTPQQESELDQIDSKELRRQRRQEMLTENRAAYDRRQRLAQDEQNRDDHARLEASAQKNPFLNSFFGQPYGGISRLLQEVEAGQHGLDTGTGNTVCNCLHRAQTMTEGVMSYAASRVRLDDASAAQVHLNLLQSMLGMIINDLDRVCSLAPALQVRVKAVLPPFLSSKYRLGDALLRAQKAHQPGSLLPFWTDLLFEAQQERREDVTGQHTDVTGANLSKVITFGDGDDKQFFKAEEKTMDILQAYSAAVNAQPGLSPVQKTVFGSFSYLDSLAKAEKNYGKYCAEKEGVPGFVAPTLEVYFLSDEALKKVGIFEPPTLRKILYDILIETKKHLSTTKNAEMIGIAGGEDLTGRNVATTKLSELFGMSKLLVRSEFRTLQTDTGSSHGYVMGKAKGVDYSGLPKLAHDEADSYTGEFQRQLVMLQVFDNVIGQADRHLNNIFYDISVDRTTGKMIYSGLTGIDNDICGGTDFALDSRRGHQLGCVKDAGAEDPVLRLPCMDAGLYSQLMAVTPEVLRANMTGLMSPRYVEAMVERFQIVRTAAENSAAEAEKHGRKFLYEPDEWGADTFRMLTKGSDSDFTNYVQRMYLARKSSGHFQK